MKETKEPPAPSAAAAQARHWRRTRRLTLALLALWFALTLSAIVFARELSAFHLFGWPLSSYLAAQGVPVLFLAIVGVYVWGMQAIDRARADDGGAERE